MYLHTWGCAYQDAYILGEGHPLQGVYLHSWRCAYQDTYVLGEGHPLQGVYLHSWGCAYQDTCVLGEGHPLQGVYLHSWGCAYQDAYVLGEGHPLQGVYLHNWGVASTSAASTTGCVPSSLGVCIPGHMCTVGVPSLQPVKNIYSLELKQTFVYETIFIKLKVHRYDPSGAYGKTCN